jgi:hypothetical protein
VPPDGALRFTEALRATYAVTPERLDVTLHPETAHRFTEAMWEGARAWFRRFT